MTPGPTDLPRRWRTDALLALLLAALLSACWAVRDWPQLGNLNLPDSDDMMRLAQVRDWVAGQSFNDWTQYRLGPLGGAPMHWSRIADLGPAAIIVMARPLVGGDAAERLAILLWPALLFAVALFLSARIARRIGSPSSAPIALVLAAIAYPANSLFLPGRIDHHGLQIVLVLGAILALARAPSRGTGAIAGICAAISFGIGLETAPQFAAMMAFLFLRWALHGAREGERSLGFGLGLAAVTAGLLLVARPSFWSSAWCDAFTPASSSAMLVAAGLFAVFGAAGDRIATVHGRLLVGGGLGLLAVVTLAASYPVCLTGPYGPMDPFVRHALIDNIVEARGVFAGPLAQIVALGIPSAGLMLTASVAGAVLAWRRGIDRSAAAPLLAVLAISDLVLLSQLRGGYVGSAVTAPILAQMVLAARVGRRPLVLAAAWAVSAGMLWLLIPLRIGEAMAPASRAAMAATRSCRGGDAWRQLDRVPQGTVMASAANAAYVIGGSHHRSVAAGYHRNNAGNVAMYDFFLSSPERARIIGRRWGVDYVVACPTDFSELDVTTRYPGSLATSLAEGRPPAWLVSIPLRDTGLKLYRVESWGG